MTSAPNPLTLSEDDRRELILWAAACAERVLPLFESERPDDARPRDAIAGARDFARGTLAIGPARALAVAAHAAARDATTPPAIAAARASGHAVAVAHMAAHARQVPVYALRAAGGSTAEMQWQRTGVPARFADYVYGVP